MQLNTSAKPDTVFFPTRFIRNTGIRTKAEPGNPQCSSCTVWSLEGAVAVVWPCIEMHDVELLTVEGIRHCSVVMLCRKTR
jgi:hypothetical protein